jgi:hypothetical protein
LRDPWRTELSGEWLNINLDHTTRQLHEESGFFSFRPDWVEELNEQVRLSRILGCASFRLKNIDLATVQD